MVIQKVESMRGRKSDFVVLKSNIQVLRMQEKLVSNHMKDNFKLQIGFVARSFCIKKNILERYANDPNSGSESFFFGETLQNFVS